MDKSNSVTMHSAYTRNENFANAKDFVRELKVCTLDPARYLQRCIAVSTSGSSAYTGSYVSSHTSKELNCLPSTGTLRNISVSKRSFLSEKPDSGMITNIITSRAPGNYYSPQTLHKFPTLSTGVNTIMGGNHLANVTGMRTDNTESPDSPKKLLLKMLHSAVIAAKNKHAAHFNSKKRKKKKKNHSKSKRHSAHKNECFPNNKKSNSTNTEVVRSHKPSETNAKAVTKISLQNIINEMETYPRKDNSMINKMLEETEEMLRITFLSNIRCSSNASSTPKLDFLENSDTLQLVNNFFSKLLYCARNTNIDENNHQSRNTFISTTVTRKSKGPMKKGITNVKSRVSAICKRKDISTTSVRKFGLGRDHSLQGKPKIKQKRDRLLSIGLGRPGKDDTEEAELAHCTIQPDPPSAISAPYRERNSSTKPVSKSPFPLEPVRSVKSDENEEKPSYTLNYLQRLRDPVLEHGDETKPLSQGYNSQITYICPSTELNLKQKEADSANGSGENDEIDLAAENKSVSAVRDTSTKKALMEQKTKPIESVEKKTNINSNNCRTLGRMASKSFAATRSFQQRKVSDKGNKLSTSVVQTGKPRALRSNNKQIFKKQSERKLYNNAIAKNVTNPRSSCSFTSGGYRYTLGDSRYQRQQKRFTLPGKDSIRLNADVRAERRFFNRNEHLLFLARPNTRYAEDTKQRYSGVLDPYHVRNLNTIIYCNQAEEHRLKWKRKALSTEEFIQEALRYRGSRPIFEEVPPPNVSEASSLSRSGSEHSFCTEADSVPNLTEEICLQGTTTEEIRRKSALSIIQEEQEDLEDADKLFVSISTKGVKDLNVSSLRFDVKETFINEKNTQGIIKSSIVHLDYRVSDRFQTEVQDIDINEIRNEVDDILVLHGLEIASEEPEYPAQKMVYVTTNSDASLPIQLYKSMETVASNISTFIKAFQGLELTLKDIQENCRFSSVSSRNYITHEEIQKDCTQALLKAKKTNSYPQKCLVRINSAHIMRCEVFTDTTLALWTTNLCNKNFGILNDSSEKSILVMISDTEEKNAIWNKLITVNINYTPILNNKLDYYSTISHSNLLQKFIGDPSLLRLRTKSSKAIDIARTNGIEYIISDTSTSTIDCKKIMDGIISLLLLKVFENVESKNTLLSNTNKKGIQSSTYEEQTLLTNTNPGFAIEAALEEFFNACQNTRSDELQQQRAQSYFNKCRRNTSAIHENTISKYVKDNNHMYISEFNSASLSDNLSVVNKNTNYFQNKRSIRKYLVENYFMDLTNNNESISDDSYFKVAHGFENVNIDEFGDSSHVNEKPINESSAECFKKAFDIPKQISQGEIALKRIVILKNFKKSKENLEGTRSLEGSHSLASHNVYYMLWASFRGGTKEVLSYELKELSGKAADDTRDSSSGHEITAFDSSPPKKTSVLEVINYKLMNDEESCLKQPITPILTIGSVSKHTQIDITIQEEEEEDIKYPEKGNLKIDKASLGLSSSRQQNMLTSTIKFAFLAFAALFAASYLPSTPLLSQLFSK